MASLWSRKRTGGKDEQRLSLNEWANMFSYDGNQYTLKGYGGGVNGYSESIDNDFCGYIQGAYKASGVVFACEQARLSVFSEMRFQYQRLANGRPGDLFGTKELALLEHPWPNGTTGELLARALQDADFAGNHFVVTEGTGSTARLRRLRPDWVDIVLSQPPDKAVASDVVGYLYSPGGDRKGPETKFYPADGSMGRIAHWSPLPDPEAQYRGMSWLTPVIREIMGDKAATRHKLKFFENAAVPSLAVAFKETVTEEQFKMFMSQMDDAHSGTDNAYKTLYLGGGADVTVVGADLKQMDFKVTQGAGETRIAAAARVPASIVGLSEGLQGSSLNEGNFKASKELFASGTLRPLWRSLCAAYQSLVAEFEDARLWYDDRDVAFLRQDRMDVAEIQRSESQTITALVMNGYTPDSVTDAVMQQDWALLKHSGLYSVQLWPPESNPAQNQKPNSNNPNNPKDGGDESDDDVAEE